MSVLETTETTIRDMATERNWTLGQAVDRLVEVAKSRLEAIAKSNKARQSASQGEPSGEAEAAPDENGNGA